MNISDIFNEFAGKEVNMVENSYKYRGTWYRSIIPAPDDLTIAVMKKTAEVNGLKLRVLWTGHPGTTPDIRSDRVNVFVEKSADGKWRVTPNFNIG